MKILKSRLVQFTVTVGVSLLIFSFLFSKINVEELISVMYRSNLKLILLTVVISLLANIFLGAERWRRILQALGCPLSYREVFYIRTGCIPLKIVFPMKSSELFKALYLYRRRKLPFAQGVSSLILEKVLNVLATLGIFLFGLSSLDLKIHPFIPIGGIFIIIFFLFSSKMREFCIIFSKIVHPKLYKFILQLFSSFEYISPREKGILIFYSLWYQFSEFFNTYILFRAVGIEISFFLILALVPLIMIVNNLPITILGLGTREGLIVFLFAKYGTSGYLLSAGMLVSFVEHILPVVIGLFFIKTFLIHLALEKG